MKPEVMDQLIADWEKREKVKGRHVCPCGFVGGSQNIRKHKEQCAVWQYHVSPKAEIAEEPGENIAVRIRDMKAQYKELAGESPTQVYLGIKERLELEGLRQKMAPDADQTEIQGLRIFKVMEPSHLFIVGGM